MKKRREIRKRARRMFPAALRSLTARTLLFALTLLAAGLFAKPWKWEWLRMDEAAGIAEDFLLKQGANLGNYTLLQVAEYREGGEWSAWENERSFALNPAVGYQFHYFHEGELDGWMVAVSPAGQIYRVRRDIPDDEPDQRLNRDDAFNLILQKLATDLALPAYQLVYESDTLISQPQRSDWIFRFTWPEDANLNQRLEVTLSGTILSNVSLQTTATTRSIFADSTRLLDPTLRVGDDTTHAKSPSFFSGKIHLPAQPLRSERSRLLIFVLIMFGVFQGLMHHRTPLALKAAGIAGGVFFALIVLQKALTFPQAAILIPYDADMHSFLARIALGAVVEALQVAIVIGLIVATGEAISRDLLPNVTTLTRVAPSQRGWIGSWVQAGRYALPLASVVLLGESLLARHAIPLGFSAQSLPIIASTLTSPFPSFALPTLSSIQVLWEEGLYRLWLLPLLLFWLRGPLTAMLLSALITTYFAGYNPVQWLSISAALHFCWALLSGWLAFRVGILSAILFHALVLGGYAGLALIWTGYGMTAGVILLSLLLILFFIIGIRGDRMTKE
jgi:hypothetical protein